MKIDEKYSNVWSNLGWYLFDELEKEWPYFWSDDLSGFYWFICDKDVPNEPQKCDKSILINYLKEYCVDNCISLSLLTNKYKDLEIEMNRFTNCNFDLYIEWKPFEDVFFDFSETKKFIASPEQSFKLLEKQFNFTRKSAELIATFSSSNSAIEQARIFIQQEFERFEKKWCPIIEKESLEANNILNKIIEQGLFKTDGTLIESVFETA